MKIKYYCALDEEENRLTEREESEFFQDFEGGNFKAYYDFVLKYCLYPEEVDFKFEEIDTSVYIELDGGEMIRLKTGEYVNICWRYNSCRVWRETNKSTIDWLNNIFGF